MNENERPCAVLKSEHQVILRVVKVLGRLVQRTQTGGDLEREAFRQCVEFLRLFADACHHAKEEDLLFPKLESCGIPRDGGPIGVMLEEHKLARRFTQEMSDALDASDRGEPDARDRLITAANGYVELLTDHIYKEDNILFTMGDRVMSPEDQSELGERFCEVGCRTFGGKKREELTRMADELEAAWCTD